MVLLQDHRFPWSISAAFVILPHLCLGLLSDYKICGDSECESLMSRVQAIKDHHGKDCRFLSFKRGDTISVYHKLAGKREDLWGGSIDKQFGYFPKDAVREEQVYATKEKVVETQKSDFFCMDEFGYPIDSTHLDTDDEDNDQKIQILESETIKITPHTDDKIAESPPSSEASTESPVSAQNAEEDQNKHAAGSHEETHETLNEQGGSPSSSWLGSSVTGWLGLAKDEQPGSSVEEEKEDGRKESDTSLTSSVTGWLGFGEQGKSDEAKESVEIEEKTADSLTSTMTGWLGFGGEKKTDSAKGEEKEEPAEIFRSRKMSLDLEGSQLYEEEKKEVGTLGWLGNGLSNTLGFGLTNQESGHETARGGEGEEEREQPVSSSWLDVGIGDILGFKKDKKESGERRETEKERSSQQPTASQSVDTSQSQPLLTDDVNAEKSSQSQQEQRPEDQSVTSTGAVSSDSDSTELIDESQSSMSNSFFQLGDKGNDSEENKKEDNTSAELEGEDHEIPESTGNVDGNSEPGEEDVKTGSVIDQDFITPLDNTTEQHVGKAEKDVDDQLQMKTECVQEEGAQITNQESLQTQLPHREVLPAQTEESAEKNEVSDDKEDSSRQSQLFLSSAEERSEPIPAKEDSLTPQRAEANNDTPDINGNVHTEAEKDCSQLELVEESSTYSTSVSTDSLHGSGSEEDRGSTAHLDQVLVSSQRDHSVPLSDSDEDKLKEIVKENTATPKQVHTEKETPGSDEDVWSERDLNEMMEMKEEEKQQLQNGITEEERHEETEELKEEMKKIEDTKESEIHEKVEEQNMEPPEVKEGEEQEKIKLEEIKEEEEEEFNEERNQPGVKEEEQDEEDKVKEEEGAHQEDVRMEEGWQKEGKEVQRDANEIKGNAEQEEDQDLKDEEENETDDSEEREKQEKVEEMTGEEAVVKIGEDMEEVQGEEQLVEELNEEEKPQKTELGEEARMEDFNEHKEVKEKENLKLEPESNEEEVKGGISLSFNSQQAEEERGEGMKEEDVEGKHQVFESDGESSGHEEMIDTGAQSEGAGRTDQTIPSLTDSHSETDNTQPEDTQTQSDQHIYTQEHIVVRGESDSNIIAPETSDQPAPHVSEDTTAESESTGAFGLFKNAFGFFTPKPSSTTKESGESVESFNINPGENTEASPTQQPASTTDTAKSSEQPQPQPPAVTESNLQTAPPESQAPLQTKILSKHYKNLLDHMTADETSILLELFGQHKLQFLDYILDSSEAGNEGPDGDQSILSDLERLVHHHREALVAPSISSGDTPQEGKDKSRKLTALQKLETLMQRVRDVLNTGKSEVNHQQAEASCTSASCHSKDKDANTGEESSVTQDGNIHRDEWMQVKKENGQVGHDITKESKSVKEKTEEKEKGSKDREASLPHVQPGSPEKLEGTIKQMLDLAHLMTEASTNHMHAVRELLIRLTVQMEENEARSVVSSLPDDIRPGPDLYGVPWEPVIFSSLVGLVTLLLFTCRCYSSIKSRMYRSKERWMAEQVAQLLDEKCKVLETLSQCQQEYDDLENSLRDSGVLAQTQKEEHLEIKARQLGHGKRELERDLEQLKDQLDHQRKHRIEQERRIAALEESMKTIEEETRDLQSQEEQAQTTLKVYNMNSDRLQRNLETAGEENTVLQESNAQLRQQVEGWAERVSELEAEMRRCEVAHSGMLQDVANKDERIMSLTDRLLRMKAWDSDLEEEEGEEKERTNGTSGQGEKNGRGDTQGHLQKVQKLIYAAKLNADLKSVDEDKDRVFAKLNDEVKAKEDLQVSIEELENEKLSLQSDTEHYSEQVQRLQQKLQIMTEMYQENELKLHRLLTVEEKERLQKEEKLNKADKNIAMAMEELNNYRQRAEEMEDELEKTKQSYQTQISAHEKKAHNNWLAARAAERDLADIRRENALLRQKLTDTQFKLDALDKDPYALESLARPLPFRAERSPYGPSPLGRPASETRAFLSPPTLMDGPPARLSPRVPRGPGEPPSGQGEAERSGGPHSDSGSISPTWERDRRGPPPGPPGPLGPPGYMFPEPGGPMYRRPPPPPGAMGLLPPPGSLPPGSLPPGPLPPVPLPPGPLHPRGLPPGPPHPTDMADGSYRENSFGPGEQEHRESGPGDRRTPPEADPRMVGPPPPGPPVRPMDGPFPRRAPYGPPPPPDFYPPRGPGGAPGMPMWAPRPPGMMFPPRFPPGGPPLPPAPHPRMPSYGAHMRPPPPEGLPPASVGPPPRQQSLPSPPHSQSPEENTSLPEDAI